MKRVESICVTPSVFVTAHIRSPQVVRPKLLVTSVSVHCNLDPTPFTLYVSAGSANLVTLIVRMSVSQEGPVLVTTMVKTLIAFPRF